MIAKCTQFYICFNFNMCLLTNALETKRTQRTSAEKRRRRKDSTRMYEDEVNWFGCSILCRFLFLVWWFCDGGFVVVVATAAATDVVHAFTGNTAPDSLKVVCWAALFHFISLSLVVLKFLVVVIVVVVAAAFWFARLLCVLFFIRFYSHVISAQRRSRITHMHFNHFDFQRWEETLMSSHNYGCLRWA